MLLLGILLFMSSCVPIGYVIYLDALVQPDAQMPLSRGGATDEASFTAEPGTMARFKVQADISTDSVQEDLNSLDDQYQARFKFPIHYAITDSGGRVLVRKNTVLAWKDGPSITKLNEQADSSGGRVTASTSLAKFTVPADGRFNISLSIDPDTTYKASYAAPQLQLFAGLADNTWYFISAALLGIGGFLLALAGFIFLLTSAAQASSRNEAIAVQDPGAVRGQSAGSSAADINTNAMIIQLSAFAGYFVPFGNIILPVVLWLIWRDRDPYLNRMGSEAVNFQISMLIYYVVCVLLMIVLIGFLLIFAALIFHLTFIIIAAVQTSRGVEFRYPMTIRFIRV